MENQSLYVLFSNYLSDEKYDHPANRKSIFAISQNADIWYFPGLQTLLCFASATTEWQARAQVVASTNFDFILILYQPCLHFFALGFPSKDVLLVPSVWPARAALVIGEIGVIWE